MFRLFSAASGAYTSIPLCGISAPAGASYPRFFYQPIIGPFRLDNGETAATELGTYLGEIHTSPKDEFGERNCLHRKPDGDLYIPQFELLPITGYYNCYKAFNTTTSKELQFSNICNSDCDQHHVTEVPNGLKFHTRTAVSGRNVFTGYLKFSSLGTPQYLTVSFYKFTYSQDWKKYCYKKGYEFTKASTWSEYQFWLSQMAKENVESIAIPGQKSALFNLRPKQTLIDPVSVKRIFNLVKSQGLYDPMIIQDLRDEWGDLAQKSADQMDYCTVNVIQFLRELRDWRKLIPKIEKIASPKTWSNWFLSYRYGLPLTITDTQSIVKSLKDSLKESIKMMDQPPKVLHAVQSSAYQRGPRMVDVTLRYKVISERYPSVVMNIVREMKSWGLYPTLLNSWDMIPYSFVADWFISFDDLFAALDARIFWQYFKVLSVCRSQKYVTVFSGKELLPEYPVVGDVSFTYYHREIRRHMDLPRLKLDTPSEFRNYAELTALIVQRKR